MEYHWLVLQGIKLKKWKNRLKKFLLCYYTVHTDSIHFLFIARRLCTNKKIICVPILIIIFIISSQKRILRVTPIAIPPKNIHAVPIILFVLK